MTATSDPAGAKAGQRLADHDHAEHQTFFGRYPNANGQGGHHDEEDHHRDEQHDDRAADDPEEGTPSEDRSTTWEPVPLGPVLDGTRTKISPTVLTRQDGVGLLYRGKLNGFNGESETLKSWVAAVAATQEIQAGNNVIWIDLEDTVDTITERLTALGLTRQQLLQHVHYVSPQQRLGDPGTQQVVDELLNRTRPTLVVVDSVNEIMALHGLSPNDAIDVVKMHRLLRQFASTGAAVVLLDHVVKNREDRGRWASGSERKISGLDGAAYTFTLIEAFGVGRHGIAKIVTAKDRPGSAPAPRGSTVGELRLVSNKYGIPGVEDEGAITFEVRCPAEPTGRFRPTTLMERVSVALEESGPLSKNAIRVTVTGKNDVIDLALQTLVNDRFVHREMVGQTHEHTSIVAYREAEDDRA